MGKEGLSFKDQAIFNVKLMAGPVAVLAEKWGAHIGAETWARGQAAARGFESEGFQNALGAMVKTEGNLQTYFGFKTPEQLLMRGGRQFCWDLRFTRKTSNCRQIGIWKKCRNR